MSSTYEPIATTTLGSATNTVSFTSISGSYTDLILIANLNGSGGNANIRIRLNSDSGTNYSGTALSGNGSTAVSNRTTSENAMLCIQTGSSLNNIWSTFVFNLMNYSNTTTYKTAVSRLSSAGSEVTANVNLWRSTSPVTNIEISTNSNNYASGSTFTLYGIKAE